jgi:hypothetical protein
MHKELNLLLLSSPPSFTRAEPQLPTAATENQPLKGEVISGLLVKDGQRVMQPIEGTPSLRIEGRGPQR